MTMMLRRAGLALCACLAVACAKPFEADQPGQAYAEAAAQSGAQPTAAARIEADVRWLADDAREGREAGTAGYVQAAEYVAARMAAMGLKPAGQSGWYQAVPLLTAGPILEASELSFTGADGETITLAHLDDFLVRASMEQETVDITAPAVFVGFGVSAPDEGHDDYAGLDVDGKFIVRFHGAPDLFDSERRAHYGSSRNKAAEAAGRGAVGVVGIYTSSAQKRAPWARIAANTGRSSMTWIGPNGAPNVTAPGIVATATLNVDASRRMFEGAAKTYDDVRAQADAKGGAPKGFDLPVRISVKAANRFETLSSPNVVGLIRGADPVLRDEYVVLTAHLDHLGVKQHLVDQGKDGLHNGAIDNALGVAVMLEAARRLSADPPARSVVVLAVTAEEKGLLGADYFARFPTVDKDSIVANVNLDMPVMLHSFTDVVAFGAERSTLGPIAKSALAEAGIALSPDPFPEQNIFTRSDHYTFVQQGVPAIYLFPGFGNGGEASFGGFMKDHYHKPSDEASLPILYEDVARFADVNVLIARGIADAPERPRWHEGDFFGDLFAGER